jgi:hypothetical protein
MLLSGSRKFFPFLGQGLVYGVLYHGPYVFTLCGSDQASWKERELSLQLSAKEHVRILLSSDCCYAPMNSNIFIWIPPLNAVITKGDYLMAARNAASTAVTVCIVKEVILPHELRVTWWLTREQLAGTRRDLRLPPPPTISAYSNVLKCRLMEVFEDCGSVSTISASNVHDIAFVFHPDVLETKFANCAGMSRVFFTRYRIKRNGEFATCGVQPLSPFSYSPCEPYPSRIWYFLLEVKHNVERMLNNTKQYQPCRKMFPMKCSVECWYYFCFSMRGSNAVVNYFRRNYTEKLCHCDLSLSSLSSRKELQLVRLDTGSSLDCARKLFGSTFGIGIRNRAPNRGGQPVTMHFGDVVNIVDVADPRHNVGENRVAEFVTSNGLDFLFDAEARLLRIRVRYSRVLAQSDAVKATLNIGPLQMREAPADEGVNNFDVIPGTFFMRDEVLLEVILVNEGFVTARDNLFNEYIIGLDEAANLIDEYLN